MRAAVSGTGSCTQWRKSLLKRYGPISAIVILLGMIALVGYALPPDSPDLPVRIHLPNGGGAVIFAHQIHCEDYGIDCETCHHDGSDAYPSCGSCHLRQGDTSGTITRTEAFHAQCMGCHEDAQSGPYRKDQCRSCHVR